MIKRRPQIWKKHNSKSDYFFSQQIDYVDYKEVEVLRKFINKQGRIVLRFYNQLTAKNQRRVVKAIKRARQMALLPYTL